MKILTSAPAAEELSGAVRWYETRRPGLGGEFLDAVATAFSRIGTHPEIGTVTSEDGRTRRLLVTAFPYQVVYRLRVDEVIIVAIAHLSRRPGYWMRRQ